VLGWRNKHGLRIADAVDSSFDAHLPPQRFPVEEEGRARIRGQLLTLGALLVRVEQESVRPVALEQHHPD